jgi:hypothetical protein
VLGSAAASLLDLASSELAREVRGSRMAMIFQEPMTSLNPGVHDRRQLTETMLLHRAGLRAEATERAVQLLERVGITGAAGRLGQYPHQLSGGQRQRVMIAMALMNGPRSDRRRADHRARRDGAGADPAAARRAAAEISGWRSSDHAQPGRRLARRRPGGRHVRGEFVETGARPRCSRPAASLHARLLASIPSRDASSRARGWAPFPASCRRCWGDSGCAFAAALRARARSVPGGAAANASRRGTRVPLRDGEDEAMAAASGVAGGPRSARGARQATETPLLSATGVHCSST